MIGARCDMAAAQPVPMSMPEIAALAGVRRPVVTNWRRRHPDFPPPLHQGPTPEFDATLVCEWLATTGRGDRATLAADLYLHTRVRHADGVDMLRVLTSLICLHDLAGLQMDDPAATALEVDPYDDMVASEIMSLGGEVEHGAKDVDELVDAAWGAAPAFERVLLARRRLGPPSTYENEVVPLVGRLMVGVSGLRERAAVGIDLRVADPAAGAGDLLAAAVTYLGPDHSPRILANEPDPYLARLLRRRLTVHGVPSHDQTIGAPDGADAVLTQLPYRPLEERSAKDLIAQVDDIAMGLAPGCTAVVLGPADALVDGLRPYSPAERARADLLRSGMVEAVIRLPGGAVPFRPAYATALWVLTPAHGSPWRGRVLLGDVSDRPLTLDTVDALITDVATWRRDGFEPVAHSRAFCTEVEVGDLVDRPRALTTRRGPGRRTPPPSGPPAVARLTELEATLSGDLATGLTATAGPSGSTTAVRALVAAGQLAIVAGSRIAAEHITPDGTHPLLGAPGGVDRLALAEHYPRATLTEPGDVVVTTAPGWDVRVDEAGFGVVVYPARALRVLPAEGAFLTPRVLASLLSASTPGERSAGAVRPARRLVDWEIPVLDPVTARQLDAVLAAVDERRRRVAAELDALDEVGRIATGGIAAGTLGFA